LTSAIRTTFAGSMFLTTLPFRLAATTLTFGCLSCHYTGSGNCSESCSYFIAWRRHSDPETVSKSFTVQLTLRLSSLLYQTWSGTFCDDDFLGLQS
jgi:hypothetical protein